MADRRLEITAELTDEEVDQLLERFDQTEPKLQRQIIAMFCAKATLYGGLAERVEELELQRDKLQAFKDWVHAWLTRNGVPEDPNPQRNAATGCRIGGRLEWLKANLRPRVDSRSAAEKQADGGW